MKRVYKNNKRTNRMLNKCSLVYGIFLWARYGVVEEYFTGRFVKDCFNRLVPEVFYYYDGNGTRDEWHRGPITNISTGPYICHTFTKDSAESICTKLNKAQNCDLKHSGIDSHYSHKYECKLTTNLLAYNLSLIVQQHKKDKDFDWCEKFRITLENWGQDVD